MRAGPNERFAWKDEILCQFQAPATAMDEHQNWRLREGTAVDVEAFDFGKAVRNALGWPDAGQGPLAGQGEAFDDLRGVGRVGNLRIRRV